MKKVLLNILVGLIYILGCVVFYVLFSSISTSMINAIFGRFEPMLAMLLHLFYTFVISAALAHKHIKTLFKKFSFKEIRVSIPKLIVAAFFLFTWLPFQGNPLFMFWFSVSRFLYSTGIMIIDREGFWSWLVFFMFWFNFIHAFSRKPPEADSAGAGQEEQMDDA
ncbi:MAG: hypothetical protein FWB74_08650 [Defluviitaleaceae bacterium]|nr:hypothetical protein [Defluviitaleaceae bacterium]